MVIASAILELAGMGLVFVYIRAVSTDGGGRAFELFVSVVGQSSYVGFALVMGVLVVGFYLGKNVLHIVTDSLLMRFVFGLYEKYSALMFDTYLGADYQEHLRRGTVELRRNLTAESAATFNEFFVAALRAASDALIIVTISVLLFVVSWPLTVGAIILFGSSTVLYTVFARRRGARLDQERREHVFGMSRWLSQSMSGFKEIRLLRRKAFFLGRFGAELKQHSRASRKARTLEQLPRAINETLLAAGVMGAVTYFVLAGGGLAAALPVLALFGVASMRTISALSRLMGCWHSLRVHAGSVHKTCDEFERFHGRGAHLSARYDSIKKDGRYSSPANPIADIEVKCVGFAYDPTIRNSDASAEDRRPALVDVSLRVPSKSFVGFVGSSGSGKSTLVNLITGLLTPTSGSICVGGRDIRDFLPEWQSSLGVVQQAPYMASETIKANVAIGIAEEEVDESRVWWALERARLAQFVRGLPAGLRTNMREEAAAFSGGERQRVAIARALYADPRVLIFDEATSALDNETEKEVLDSVLEFAGEKTILSVAHRLSTMQRCDTVFVLHEGRLLASGRFLELLETCEPFKRMVELGQIGSSGPSSLKR